MLTRFDQLGYWMQYEIKSQVKVKVKVKNESESGLIVRERVTCFFVLNEKEKVK